MSEDSRWLDANHGDVCRMLGVPQRQPTDNPIVGKMTEVEIMVEGKRVKKWGGSVRCLYCDYEVSGKPDISVCPNCGAGSWQACLGQHRKEDPIPVTCSHCGEDSFVEPSLRADATLFCVQCGKRISRSEEE